MAVRLGDVARLVEDLAADAGEAASRERLDDGARGCYAFSDGGERCGDVDVLSGSKTDDTLIEYESDGYFASHIITTLPYNANYSVHGPGRHGEGAGRRSELRDYEGCLGAGRRPL